jgi:hypothetical protein
MLNVVTSVADCNQLTPNLSDITAHLYALFSPTFVRPYSDSWIEIAYGSPTGKLNRAGNFSAFDIEQAAQFALKQNKAGNNVYVGAALRHGEKPASGRANADHVVDASHVWAEYDKLGDDNRIGDVLVKHGISPAIVVTTGTITHPRRHIYFRIDGAIAADKLLEANGALAQLLAGDAVQDAPRVLRLAGTINYPTPEKLAKGYVVELTTLHINKDAPAYQIEALTALSGGRSGDPYIDHGREAGGRSDEQIIALLEKSKVDHWHDNMRDAIASMIGRGWPDAAIKMTCRPYCKDGQYDADLPPMIDKKRIEWNKPNIEGPPSDGTDSPSEIGTGTETDVERLNRNHAVLPIGGKTRVVTFGEMPEFPGRETVVMTQSLPDFAQLHSKYRHSFRNKKGETESVPLGTHWLGSTQRRQYDGGMAFMPNHDGDFGNKLNLYRGFGVKSVKPNGKTGADGCDKFLEFMLNIICSGNAEHFDYLLKREATIIQKRIRSEIAIGLSTREEGAGKGFYEKTMTKLLGSHAMQVTNPQHIIGKFNPHLETLLRLTADEALFVGNHDHRNSLFGLVTESKLTIEPKGLGVYQADNYLNISVLSNSPHFLPVGPNARRFFIPTVSIERMQDFQYFGAIQEQLDAGGYEALLYHLQFEVDLAGFNVRDVPKTAGLREQRNMSIEPLDSWWAELLETGTLMGSDPEHPERAVSNAYQREVKTEPLGAFGSTQVRFVNQRGLYDQGKTIEPKLRNVSDTKLGTFLGSMGCDNTRKVLRKQGWWFPPLADCRTAWEAKYPDWRWRNPDLAEWQPEEDGDDVEVEDPRPAVRIVAGTDVEAKAAGATLF